jgi:hypothetical protein
MQTKDTFGPSASHEHLSRRYSPRFVVTELEIRDVERNTTSDYGQIARATPLILFRREIEGTCRRDPEEPPSHAAAGEGNRLGRRWRAVRADRPRPLLASRRTPAPLELQATVPDYMVPFALIL